jgi:hypothetical protein
VLGTAARRSRYFVSATTPMISVSTGEIPARDGFVHDRDVRRLLVVAH